MEAAIEMMPAEMLVRHPTAATRPEQCNPLFDWSFINQAWMASFDIRSYREWFLDADYTPMYEAHRERASRHQIIVGQRVAQAPDVAVLANGHRQAEACSRAV